MSARSDVYFNAIRSALANGNAAVMVGAGFSRNAEGGSQLSTWPQLAKELALALDPQAKNEQFSTANVTQLAEQYARVFSTPTLETLLKRSIPDQHVAPGSLHTRLMELPWSEIFTTNYDTLLERTAEKMIERAHFTVCCREDIPQSKILGRRRIVKLHGSFPSQRPFIFTEEDYRTYPQKFAPFVNLVRQSLLENVFCLIGFSGDDPNFLHWLGWVRDMLDKHALPVYLFLTSAPNLGQLKLLEARGVTPVLLPPAPNGDPANYQGRYLELFKRLSEPLEGRDDSWGNVSWPETQFAFEKNIDLQYQELLGCMPALAEVRKTYPGWLVAPRAARQRMQRSMDRLYPSIESKTLLDRLDQDAPLIALTVLSLGAWSKEVQLQPLNDNAANLGLKLVRQTADLKFADIDAPVRGQLELLGISSHSALTTMWGSLTLSLVRWARQSMLEPEFRELCALLQKRAPDSGQVLDSIQYEQVLLEMHRGERKQARARLRKWTIQSPDAMFLLRKGVLTAELADFGEGLALCKEAIQQLREAQKLQPIDPGLLSQEAWACFITSRLQGALPFIELFGGPDTSTSKEQVLAGLDDRLETIALHGIAVKEEVSEIIADLKAEAQQPYRAQYKFASFELGASSEVKRFGFTNELQKKILASFAWLELTERVALPMRTSTVAFDADYLIQAAWWIKYADSTYRVLSVFVRALVREGLKPKDESLPPHKSGWFSRYQVACMPEALAVEFCTRILREVQETLSASINAREQEIDAGFFIDLFSRLVLRVTQPQMVFGWGIQIAHLHATSALQSNSNLWEPFAIALARVLETLPADHQARLLREIARLPHEPATKTHEVFMENWIRPFNLLSNLNPIVWDETGLDWVEVVDAAIQALETSSTPSNSSWMRVAWLNALGVLSSNDRQRVSKKIWQANPKWVTLPGFYPHATFDWPVDKDIDLNRRYMEWLEKLNLEPFPESGMMTIMPREGRRGWGLPPDDSYLAGWKVAVERNTWSVEHLMRLIDQIERWWIVDSQAILVGIKSHEEVANAFKRRLNLIDRVVASAMRQMHGRPELDQISARANDLADMVQKKWKPLLQVSALLYIQFNDEARLQELFGEANRILLGTDESEIAAAASMARMLLAEMGSQPGNAAVTTLIDTLLSILLARRMPGLIWTLSILADATASASLAFQPHHWAACDLALGLLLTDLRYEGRNEGSDIVDDAVPLLRFSCARLAHYLTKIKEIEAPNALSWLREATKDPLPELRMGRFVSPEADASEGGK